MFKRKNKMKYNETNFFENTKAVFLKTTEPKREADFTSYKGRLKFLITDHFHEGREWEFNRDFLTNRKSFSELELNEEIVVMTYPEPVYANIKKFEDNGILVRIQERVSSEYWYTKTGVYRCSTHWGNVGDCQWQLNEERTPGDFSTGFCQWSNFKRNNKIT